MNNLKQPISREVLINRFDREMDILCGHFQDCDDKPSYLRVIFCVRVTQDLFDVLFNSEYGLRAAYFRSPGDGDTFNRKLLNALMPKLLEWANCADLDARLAEHSLSGASAKIWLAESTLDLCSKCVGEWSNSITSDLTIVNGRWETSSEAHANWGVMAHHFTKLRVFGAFVDGENEEYVAPRKRNRSEQIFEHGWS